MNNFLEAAEKHLKKKTEITERTIESAFVTYATKKKCKAMKLVLLLGKGFPDRTVLCPGGKVIFIEFKRKGKKLSMTQKSIRNVLVDLGFSYSLCDEIGQAEKILDNAMETS